MNYSEDKNTYYKIIKGNPKDFVQKEIGDSKQSDFYPQQKISRWDNEVNVSFRLIHDEKNPTVSSDADTVYWKGDKIEAQFYEISDEDGASEFEITLKEKPQTNVVQFSISDKGVDYFYQQALTEEQIKKGHFRPENVIGSYAIYTSNKNKNVVGGKEYRCGKVGHIYRPKIVDATGSEVWGDLKIENGMLSVTIPQDFLDNAVYPVRHAAGLTFGYSGHGNTYGNFAGERYGHSSSYWYTASAGDTITSFSFYGEVNPAGSATVGMGVYSVVSGNYSSLLGSQTNVTVNSTTAGWFNSSTVSIAMSNAVTYGVAVSRPSNTFPSAWAYYDSLGTQSQSVLGANLPASWGTNDNQNNFHFSIYATYTGGSSGPANLKTYNTNVKSNIKSINTNLLANVKTLDTNI